MVEGRIGIEATRLCLVYRRRLTQCRHRREELSPVREESRRHVSRCRKKRRRHRYWIHFFFWCNLSSFRNKVEQKFGFRKGTIGSLWDFHHFVRVRPLFIFLLDSSVLTRSLAIPPRVIVLVARTAVLATCPRSCTLPMRFLLFLNCFAVISSKYHKYYKFYYYY